MRIINRIAEEIKKEKYPIFNTILFILGILCIITLLTFLVFGKLLFALICAEVFIVFGIIHRLVYEY